MKYAAESVLPPDQDERWKAYWAAFDRNRAPAPDPTMADVDPPDA